MKTNGVIYIIFTYQINVILLELMWQTFMSAKHFPNFVIPKINNFMWKFTKSKTNLSAFEVLSDNN